MRFWHAFPVSTLIALPTIAYVLSAADSDSRSPLTKLDYNFHIRPILADRCFICHGPDEKKRKANLRLDAPDSAHADGVIVPGKPAESKLIQRITAPESKRMPPRKSNLSLSKEEIEVLRRWVAEGAEYKPHWAFLPLPEKVAVPVVKQSGGLRLPLTNPIDHFIITRLEQEGLAPSPAAAKEDWIRRVTFDLTGLPSGPADVDAFLADQSPLAFEKIVDRLLASPRFGERMAQEWLDVARYADSFGYQADGDMHVWPWRDWVITAFNQNLPFDQFLTWQLAGDLVEEPTREQRLATAFCRIHRLTNEGGSIAEEFRNESVSDRVHTFATVFLGLTLECARCHDHKYDPVTMRDYYSLGAFFNSIDEWGTYDNSIYRPTPTLLLPTPEQVAVLGEQAKKVTALEGQLRLVEKEREAAFQEWLARNDLQPIVPGLVGHYPLDRLEQKNQLENLADPRNPGSSSPANTLVSGKFGQALRFTGDDPANFPKVAGSLDRGQPFTVSFWLQTPDLMKQGIVFHRQSGTDTGFHGTELSFDDGRLFFAMVRFWPGNAIAVRTRRRLDIEQHSPEWVHIGVSYDASSKASGLRIYINGKPAEIEVIRDNLRKDLQSGARLTYNSGATGLSFGERFRSVGLKNVAVDELRVFERTLTDLEIAHLHDDRALAAALARRDAEALRPYYLHAVDPEVAQARDQLLQARRQLYDTQTGVFEVMTMQELPRPRPSYILTRGEYDAPKTTPASRETPSALPPFPNAADRNRLGLARWLTDPKHPLTARVTVNRYWQMFFGRGLVATTENFGQQGALPTHPELLDWLARDFIRSGWDVKAFCKRIVVSDTYRQRSAAAPQLHERDPDNSILARGPSRRLSAEMLRDAALAAGGLLFERLGGPAVKPYQPPGLWKGQNAFLPDYVADKGAGLYRRSLYTFWRRTSPPPNMLTFDAPSREVCVVRRQATSTPLQPLVLLNDPQFVEAGRALGERMLREGGSTPIERLTLAFRLCATRRPTGRELSLLGTLYQEQLDLFRMDLEGARKYLKIGDRLAPPDLDAAELAAAAVTANAILNLDAAVMAR